MLPALQKPCRRYITLKSNVGIDAIVLSVCRCLNSEDLLVCEPRSVNLLKNCLAIMLKVDILSFRHSVSRNFIENDTSAINGIFQKTCKDNF